MVKKSRSRTLSLYSNLSHARKTKKDAAARKRAQYLATLPKNPFKRLLYRLHPKRVAAYWFSKRGAIMALKILGITLLLLCLLVGGLFAYFRKDLDAIQPDQLAKSVQSTVTTYLDRNGQVLWQDTGGGNYKLVVPSSDINNYAKQATVAIEDRNFYTEGGVSISGTLRAAINNLTGGDTQGGSTLTQQLVKQVFFPPSETQDRGLAGIPRKIKELILSVEVERAYDKDQILSLYLNESPYGGPRNGIESGAQTYFGVSAKNLTLPEAALLASIPQDPTTFDPYNVDGNALLIARQHTVLDDMADQGYITKAQADAAKAVPILDSLQPQQNQYSNIKAGNFVQMVRSELQSQLGAATVGQGGLTVTTTLDLNIQNQLEAAMKTEFDSSAPARYGFSNGAATVEDTQTGQIIAMMGSKDFTNEAFGQVNAATAYIQPGSTIKPLVYAQLFQQKTTGANFGSGSKLINNDITGIYGSPLSNANGDPENSGATSIRTGLANSWNIPAVEAMAIDGVTPSIATIRALGGTSYCTVGPDTTVFLAAAIGGCGIKQTDLVNAYASLGRGGAYKPQSDILKVTNSTGSVLKQWSDTAPVQIVSPQAAYVVSDILHDDNARTFVGTHRTGMYIPGVDSAAKTGTSNAANAAGSPKDIWMVNYSQALTMAVWLGNPDTTPLNNNATSIVPGQILDTVLQYAYKTDYQAAGKWKPGDWIAQPSGIQRVGCGSSTLVVVANKPDQACGEVYPSYWNATQGLLNVDFDSATKKLATDCTPSGSKVSVSVIKLPLASSFTPNQALYIDPQGTYTLAGSSTDSSDDCTNVAASESSQAPTVGTPTYNLVTHTASVTASANGSSTIASVVFTVNGVDHTATGDGSGNYTAIILTKPTSGTDYVTVTDSASNKTTSKF